MEGKFLVVSMILKMKQDWIFFTLARMIQSSVISILNPIWNQLQYPVQYRSEKLLQLQ